MLATASLPENSKASAGSREMMSSICLAMTTVSFGVCAKADGPPSANAKQVIKVGGRRISSSPPSFIELADAPVAGLYMLFISSQHTLGKRVDQPVAVARLVGCQNPSSSGASRTRLSCSIRRVRETLAFRIGNIIERHATSDLTGDILIGTEIAKGASVL